MYIFLIFGIKDNETFFITCQIIQLHFFLLWKSCKQWDYLSSLSQATQNNIINIFPHNQLGKISVSWTLSQVLQNTNWGGLQPTTYIYVFIYLVGW